MKNHADIIILGSGNAALCAGLAAIERGARVLILEKADKELAGGNSKYTAGAMRFTYNNKADLMPLLANPTDPRLAKTDFSTYTKTQFQTDLLKFNGGRELSPEQHALIDDSYQTMLWLAQNGVKFEPIYSRQSFEKNGRAVFWGGLTLAAKGEGVGLVEAELAVFTQKGGQIYYGCEGVELICQNNRVIGIIAQTPDGVKEYFADAVILGSGGFEASTALRQKYLGADWGRAKVRGTPHNTGQGLQMALALGAQEYGFFQNCHATPMDLYMKDFGNLNIPHLERKNYRKICYFLGIMLNAKGQRFVDEGIDFRNYTYAQFGRAILQQPNQFAWQIFDAKVADLLYEEYRFDDAHFITAECLDDLIARLDGVDSHTATQTIAAFNAAVDTGRAFDPTIKDGRATRGLPLAKSNWAQALDTPPFTAYPVTCGITFTYGGLKVDESGAVLRPDGRAIAGLYACGELVGGVFAEGYPGGSGLTSGAVFGRRAGAGAGF